MSQRCNTLLQITMHNNSTTMSAQHLIIPTCIPTVLHTVHAVSFHTSNSKYMVVLLARANLVINNEGFFKIRLHFSSNGAYCNGLLLLYQFLRINTSG